MATPVVTVASGGLPVVDVTATAPTRGLGVTEAAAGKGTAVTKVAAGGLPVTYSTVADYPSGGGGGPAYATWDAATVSSVTLSGGNLVATSTGGASDHGCHVASASGKVAGKYYFEIALTTYTGGANTGICIATTTSTYTGLGNGGGVTGVTMYLTTGNQWVNGSHVGIGVSLGARATGNVICVAADLDAEKCWMRVGAAGNWNGNAAGDPASGTGYITIFAGTMVPFIVFAASGNVFTTNFGAAAFVGAVPSGFTPGWPV